MKTALISRLFQTIIFPDVKTKSDIWTLGDYDELISIIQNLEISLELNDQFLGDFVSSVEIDWAKLNASILNYPD